MMNIHAPVASQAALNRLDDIERDLTEHLDALAEALQEPARRQSKVLIPWLVASASLATAATLIVVALMR